MASQARGIVGRPGERLHIPARERLEQKAKAHDPHLRLFLDPETFEPFIPSGEVYDITRWIPGLTPEKVDR